MKTTLILLSLLCFTIKSSFCQSDTTINSIRITFIKNIPSSKDDTVILKYAKIVDKRVYWGGDLNKSDKNKRVVSKEGKFYYQELNDSNNVRIEYQFIAGFGLSSINYRVGDSIRIDAGNSMFTLSDSTFPRKLTFTELIPFKHGKYFEYNNIGTVLVKGVYKNDIKHGLWFYYNTNGEIIRKEKYKNGVLIKSQ